MVDEGRTILIIEDDPSQREIYSLILQRAGYNVTARADAHSGLSWLEQILPDAIVLDIMLPGMSGLEMLEQIRNTPNGARVPILIASAIADLSESDFSQFEVSTILRKPLTGDVLLEAMQAVFDY